MREGAGGHCPPGPLPQNNPFTIINTMLKIALTGGPGSGKSTVARMFRDLGAEVIDADEVAYAVVAPGQPAWEELRREFGPEFFQEDGSLNRAKMSDLVFQDAEARRQLNAIVHPRLTREIVRRVQDLAARGENLVIIEVPLLFEAGREKNFDVIIVVDADEKTQIERLSVRDGRTPEEAQGILKAQWPLSAKKSRADFVVDNRGFLAETQGQVKKVWDRLKRL
ncbi:MAG: dephospho-CoA kinase [Desulfobaccales bacterium]